MEVTVVDPAAFTAAYDHSLCAALARRGHAVELVTSRFRHGTVPDAAGYRRREPFYRIGADSRIAKGLQHPFEMLWLTRRLRRRPPDVVHFQWLPLPELDRALLRSFPRPLVFTAHDVLPREAPERRRRAAARLFDAVDAVVVHSEAGRERLVRAVGVPESKVAVVPHGSFDYLARGDGSRSMDPAVGDLDGRKVVLSFGLIRPYKGIDLLIEAFAEAPQDAVLLIVGRALMPLEPLRRRARELGISERVRFVPRYVPDAEVPAYFRRADVVVLPYREADQSGVLFTSLAFARPTVVTAVGGFGEVAERGAAELVPPGDVPALAAAIVDLLGDEAARTRLEEGARRAAAGPYSWDRAAELTESLYRSLLERTA
jgi:glycosyltransferase involved in cell wall biosynthesis